MKNWQKEMINIIMNGEEIHETLAKLMTEGYEGVDIYLDNLASEVYKRNSTDAEELKDYLDDEVIEHGGI